MLGVAEEMDRESIIDQKRLIAECDRLQELIKERDLTIARQRNYINNLSKINRKIRDVLQLTSEEHIEYLTRVISGNI